MAFNAVFNFISYISWRPIHLSMLSWIFLHSILHNILSIPLIAFPLNHCRNNNRVIGDRRINSVATTILSSSERNWQCRGLNQLPLFSSHVCYRQSNLGWLNAEGNTYFTNRKSLVSLFSIIHWTLFSASVYAYLYPYHTTTTNSTNRHELIN